MKMNLTKEEVIKISKELIKKHSMKFGDWDDESSEAEAYTMQSCVNSFLKPFGLTYKDIR